MAEILKKHRLTFTLLLFLVMSIVSLYITDINNGHIWSYLDIETDGRFHILRIQGLYEALKHGTIFPAVNMSFMNGLGYIVNLFYSDLWLYPAAILRFFFKTAPAFVIYYVFLNFCTFVSSFFTYKYASKDYAKSLLFSFVYTLSTYRIFDMVRRFDLGEVLTLTFLPIVVLGVYEVFYADESKWLLLTIGMVMVIYSHSLSPILIGIFIVLVMLFRLKTLIQQPKRIIKLVYSGLMALLLSAAYFLPMFEQLHYTQFKLTQPTVDVANRSLPVLQVFKFSWHNYLHQQNIGLILILVAILIPITLVKVKSAAIRDFAIIGEILLLMTTKLFPWSFFEKTPLKIIQFPWRLDMLITILFAIYLVSAPLNFLKQDWQKIILGVVVVLLMFNSQLALIRNFPNQYDSYASFDHLDSYSIGSGEEYLPKDANLQQLRRTSCKPILVGVGTVNHFKKQGTKLTFDFQGTKNTKIILPIIGYYGYSTKDSLGKVSTLTMRKNGLAQIRVSGHGKAIVDYYPTIVQQASRVISIFSLFGLCFDLSYKKIMKKRVFFSGKKIL